MTLPIDPFRRRTRALLIALLVILIVWQFLPLIERYVIGLTATPRPVVARGELAADEQSTIAIFERASPSVVYITTKQRVMDLWTRNVFNVPQGTGSGSSTANHSKHLNLLPPMTRQY